MQKGTLFVRKGCCNERKESNPRIIFFKILSKPISAKANKRYPVIKEATHVATSRNTFRFVLIKGYKPGNNGIKYHRIPDQAKTVHFKITNGKRGNKTKPIFKKS